MVWWARARSGYWAMLRDSTGSGLSARARSLSTNPANNNNIARL